MKQFGFTLATLVIIGLLGYGGYFALTSLKNPKSYMVTSTEKIGDLHKLATTPDSDSVRRVHESVTSTAPVVTPSVTTTAPTSNNSLQGSLKNLLDQKIVLKKGVTGPAVGTIQTFMNAYFKKTLKIDNDFGKTLEADVKKFQTQNKITATGQVATKTIQTMITWVQKNTN